MDGAARLLEAFGKLLGALVWPALVLVAFVLFRKEIQSFFTSLEEATFKFGGAEVSLTSAQVKSAAALAEAEAKKTARPGRLLQAASVSDPVQSALGVVADVTRRAYRRLGQLSLLWVDDNPGNNSYERQALEAFGISIVTALSTEEALAQLQRREFALVISDMSRPPDPVAGYTLLEGMRAAGNRTPFIIYAGTDTPEQRAEAERKGAVGRTSTPTALVALALRVLTGS